MAESTFKVDGGIEATGIVTATTFAKVGGTSSQFLKADGSLDSSTFLTSQSDTTYTPSAQDGQSGAKILRLTAGGSGSGDQDITLLPGNNVTLSRSNNEISIGSTFTNTDTTYSQSAVVDSNDVKLRLTNSGGIDDDIKISAGNNVSISNVTSNGFTLSSVDNNTTYSIDALDHSSNEKKIIRLTDSGNNIDDVILVTPVGSNLTISRTGDEINLQGVKYETSVVDSGVTDKYFIRLTGSGSLTSTDDVHIIGGSNISLSKVSDDITFNSTDTLDSVTDRNPTTNNTVTVGILTVTNGAVVNDITVNTNAVVKGNLTIEGTTTTIDSTNLNIGDNQIKLNYDHTGAPTQNAGLLVERGSSSDVEIRWNETDDKWQYTNDGTTFKDLGSSAISAADGNVASKKKIVLTDPDGGTDEVVLEAGTNMSASRSGDTITFNSSHVTYNYSATDPGGGNVRLNLNDSNAVTDWVQLTAGDNITFTGVTGSNITVNAPQQFPTGGIIMWSGAEGAIPSGWVLCNGSNSTPDLRDKFIVGAGTGGSYSVADTGGSTSVTLSTAELPAHTHGAGNFATSNTGSHNHGAGNYATSNTGAHTHTMNNYGGNFGSSSGAKTFRNDHTGNNNTFINSAGAHSHNISGNSSNTGNHAHNVSGNTGSVGSGTAHENRPPYYALCYIMKS